MRSAGRIRERGEIRIDRIQVIWLTLGGVVALGLMFALGVLAGRRAASFSPAPEQPSPLAQVDAEGDLHDELTFYNKLTAPTPPRGAPPTALPARPVVPKPAPPPAPAADSHGAAAPAPEQTQKPQAPASPPAPMNENSASGSAVERALAAGPARPGDYTIQVSAYQSMAEAKAYAAALERKGFKPFVVTARIPGKGVWYRVRLGRFSDETSANAGKLLLARSDIPAWVLRSE